ncbi:MAG: hypothetical protein QOF11_1613 [Chloroflexota bacterium]|jgi:hypothetical protein|nr:hypothetical protein [Chloroflexota bacterium]
MARSRRSFAYPTNHLLAVFDDPAAAAAAAAELIAAGFTSDDVTILRGDEGAERLDGLGAVGPWRRILRLFQFMTMDQMPDFLTYEAALRAGRAVVAVRVRDRPSMLAARDVLLRSGGHFMNFFGRLSTEELVRWRGPELELPNYMRR